MIALTCCATSWLKLFTCVVGLTWSSTAMNEQPSFVAALLAASSSAFCAGTAAMMSWYPIAHFVPAFAVGSVSVL